MSRRSSARFRPEILPLEGRVVLDSAPVLAPHPPTIFEVRSPREVPRPEPTVAASAIRTRATAPRVASPTAAPPETRPPGRSPQRAARLDRPGLRLPFANDVLVRPRWARTIGEVSPRSFGHNTVWSRGGLGLWDEAAGAPDPQALSLVDALRPGVLRFPGGTRAMLYHFDETIGPVEARRPQPDPFTGRLDATRYGLDEFLRVAESLGSEVTLVTPWIVGTPQEAAALVAYVNASAGSTVPIGVDVNGKDWGTAGDWAARRAANGHPQPYDVEFLEVGNEPYLAFPIAPPGAFGLPGVLTQAQRFVRGVPIPTTAADYAAQAKLTADLVHAVDPTIRVGAAAMTTILSRSDARTVVSDVDRLLGTNDPWNPRLLQVAGDSIDFLVVHPYNLGLPPGSLDLGEDLRRTIRELRALDADEPIAVTEFGTVLLGDSLQNALITADVIRVSIEERLLMTLRHILIEDRPEGPFAQLAAILGPGRRLTPGYHAERLLGDLLRGQTAVPARTSAADFRVIAARGPAGRRLDLAVFDLRPLALDARRVRVALPPGTWVGSVTTLAGPQLTSGQVALDTARIRGSGALRLPLPPNGLAFIRLERHMT